MTARTIRGVKRPNAIVARRGGPIAIISVLAVAVAVAVVGVVPAFGQSIAPTQRARSAAIRLPKSFDVHGKVGHIRLGASKNATIAAWGVPNDVSGSSSYRQLKYSRGITVRVDKHRIIGFELHGGALRGRRGVTPGSTLRAWRRAYPALYPTAAGSWLLDYRGANLAVLAVHGAAVTRVSMVYRGGSARGGGGGATAGRGGGANPFAGNGRDGKVPCAANGKSGWCWCTWWAYERRPDVYNKSAGHNGVPFNGWDAAMWPQYARQGGGFKTGNQPVVGALAVFSATHFNRAGHIAYVDAVNNDRSFVISEYNRNNDGRGPLMRTLIGAQIEAQAITFIYGAPDGGPGTGGEYIGHIVQWDGDTKQQKTAWLVVNNHGHPQRNWIPSSAIFNCLKTAGAPGPEVLPGPYLSQYLPDDIGVHASCAGAGNGVDQPPPPATPPPLPTPSPPTTSPPPTSPTPPAPTWPETAGGVAHTWTNYTNAGGVQGPSVNPSQTIQIACKLAGFRVADGNTFWYRIAQSPWNNQYYVSADAFYNNGATSGSLVGTPFVDPNVADC